MKLAVASKQGKPTAQRNSAIFWLLCLVVCYQAAYQAYISFVLSHDTSALDPWCSGSATSQGSSQQCVEAQLFQGWQSGGHDLLEPKDNVGDLLQPHIGNPEEKAQSTTQQPPRAPVVAIPAKASGSSTITPSAAVSKVQETFRKEASAPWAKSLIAMQESMRSRQEAQAARRSIERAQAAHAAIQEWRNMSTLSRDLQALHDRFGARLAERRASTAAAKDEFKHITDWAKDVQALQQHFEGEFVPHGQVTPPVQQVDNGTAWSRDLSALQQRMETRMEAHNKAHHKLDEMDARIEAHKKAHHVPEGKHKEQSLLEQISSLGKEMCSDIKHRHDPHCAQFLTAGSVHPSSTAAPGLRHLRGGAAKSVDEAEMQLKLELHQLSEKQHAWEKSFMAKVSDTMQEFCAEPMHRTQSACAQFLAEHASHTAVPDEVAKRRAWHQSFAAKIANVGHDLCSNPLRRDYRICKKILADEEHATKSTAASTSVEVEGEPDNSDDSLNHKTHKRLELHWSSVEQWQNKPSKGVHASSGIATIANVNASEVASLRTTAHWSGRVPSVACIALVPKGSAAKAWINYFIDNFRLQQYEGSHRLVLVYHSTDLQAPELLRKYVDGTYIQAHVARGDEFPSAAAFRFGAWLARSSDVIARWDFGAWHHPQRLSMQVRAMALTGRPAGLLKGWTVLDKDGANTTVRDGKHWGSSLIGEAAWMRTNWYPDMSEERDAFDAHSARDVVKLDAPGLEVFDEGM